MKSVSLFSLLLFTLALVACSSIERKINATVVYSDHPQLQNVPAYPHAKVYFIRPNTERTMGFADNRLPIELDQQPLLELVKGEYALVLLQPGSVWVSTRTETSFGAKHKTKVIDKTYEFSFSSGNTYFIEIHPVDGAFRGVYFKANSIDLDKARELTENMRPAGRAIQFPVNRLEG